MVNPTALRDRIGGGKPPEGESMKRFHALAAATAAGLVVAAGATAVTLPRVNAVVGPDTTIKVTKAGKKVTSLKAGRYTFVVADKSNAHNFHLTGPGVNKLTTVAGVGTKTWTLTLKAGTYKFVCDPHKTFMKGSFKVS
jgi:plastocyanin